ncbi:chitin synthase chs-2-like [Onthophagus taurus]|uniref:chitin synthase chs-2-like n=1 Tax=Onthophagus taurus TaxID=166361 RepID=UPI0039BE8498
MMNNEEMEPLNPLRPEQEKKKWDVFEDPPTAVESGSTVETKWIDFGEKFGKFFCYIIGFIVVLGGAVVSKGSLLFMTSQLSGKTRPYCRTQLDGNKQFTVTLPLEEKAVWMWMITFAFFVPQVGTFIRSVRILLYKDWRKPTTAQFLGVFISETCSTIGTAILVFVILPSLDVVKGIMLTNAFSFVPAVLSFSSKLYDKYKSKRRPSYDFTNNVSDPDVFYRLGLDLLCILIQGTVFFMWPIVEDDPVLWCIPVAAIFISAGWWENYSYDSDNVKKNEDSREKESIIRQILKANRKFSNSRYCVYTFVSLWKCFIFFMMMVFTEYSYEGDVTHLFANDVFGEHNITIREVKPLLMNQLSINEAVSIGPGILIKSDVMTPVWLFIICVCSTYLCYIFGKFCCKVFIQGLSYAFPINLVVPVTISGLVAMCGVHNEDECSFTDTIPPYLFFDSPPIHYLKDFVGQQHSWMWLLWLLSQVWITLHIWSPRSERLAKTERLFVRPMYEPFVIDQDLAMNRRILDQPLKESKRQEEFDRRQALLNLEMNRSGRRMVPVDVEEDSISRIYACGTMWHETKDEMMEFLKSVIRLDEDQCARRIIKSYLDYPVPDYYELETHVFFDDAFVRVTQDDPDPQINSYVKDLINAVDDAASKVHEINIRVRPPVRSVTPYGGRLVWTLPGRTKLIAHLKDKKKIRAKKRWSQVMYMYYLLGHKLMERDDWDEHKKTLRSNNTFILALDGDIDFQPKAVRLLVDLMKKDMNVGAACGRIHPIGSGPMVWYQMFEYAIGHWMQKATEHVIGCVLCSPGCFSLFRGSALMDASVMRRYAVQSSEALHYVQFDQGEDRWLCTLLLQRGYRVEYSAASDAYTHCPEGFNEFFNQRRRWMPSTTANIFDLLLSSDKTIKVNNNISRLYIGYQFVLMIGTILGPGTIFLMLVGAFVAAFQLDQWSSFMWNVVPIMIFVIICSIFTKDTIQLFVAGILSGIYSLIMMAVLVGVILQINSDGFLAPSSLFFFCVAGEMIIAALLHPKEFNCLKYGVVYYVTVPCMYMILVIYSVFNMNNVSWGTREVTVAPQAQGAPPPNPQPAKNDNKSTSKVTNLLGSKNDDTKGGFEFSLGNIFKCLFFTTPDNAGNEQLKTILDKLNSMQEPNTIEKKEEIYDKPPSIESIENFEGSFVDTSVDENLEGSWMYDENFKRGFVEVLAHNEVEFWEGILEKYLHPVDDSEEKKRIAADLKALRDKMVLAFFMLNAIFVLIVFLLTLKKDYINVKWPLEVKANFTYLNDANEIRIYKDYLKLEPIGGVFLIAFASLLFIQFIAMLIHRLKTFAQIVANTNIRLFDRSVDNLTEEEVVAMNPVEYIKKLQKLKGADDSDDEDDAFMFVAPERRPTVFRLQKSALKQQQPINDLEEAFTKRTELIDNYKGPLPRKTVEVIADRRRTIMEKRKSVYIQQPSVTLKDGGHMNRGFVNDEFTSFA